MSVLSLAVLLSPLAAQQQGAATDLRYDRDIRPILADRCFKCHGQDPAARRAELRLDEREFATKAMKHGTPIVPGDPANSEVLRRIATDDADDVMPPPGSGKVRLSEHERDLLRQWIAAGAVYEPHWSFTVPQRPSVPEVRDAAWCKNGIDRFVLANLERRGLQPGGEADRATLARRVFFAVTGLPPTPEELTAFAADARTDAYERLVDKLLNEEPYRSRHAERMATPWLDAARYADTSGIHMDAGRQIWPFRDWVLQAYRDNLPFDRFVVDQLAGDLLPKATQDQQVASGFHRCHVTTDEGGAIDEEYLVEYAADRVATTGAVFLGLTLGCARCHDHKYDPIAHDDFYRLFAYFNSNEEPGLYSQAPDANRALEPFLAVPTAQQQQKQTQLRADLDGARKALETRSPEEAAQQTEFLAQLAQKTQLQWATAKVTDAKASGSTLTIEADGSVRASGENPAQDVHTIRLQTNATGLRLLSLQALGDVHPEGRVGRAPNGNAVLQAIEVEVASVTDPKQHQRVPLVWAWADVEQQNGDYRVVNALASDDQAGWAVDAHMQPPGPRTALFLADAPFGYAGGTEVTVTLRYDSIYSQHTFGHVQLALGQLGSAGLDLLPEARSGFYVAGPFATEKTEDPFTHTCGPETTARFDQKEKFADGKKNQGWRFEQAFQEATVNSLPDGQNIVYVAQRVFAPSARTRDLSLGSDDAFRLYVDAAEVAKNKTDRAAAADQDKAQAKLAVGQHLLTMKVVNTGGQGAFYLRHVPRAGELTGELAGLLLPPSFQTPLQTRLRDAWRSSFSPGYAQKKQQIVDLEQQLAQLDQEMPRAMVMRERKEQRPTFVLKRGEYDKPDKSRPVKRGIPSALGKLPKDAEDNRLGLAKWMVAPDNPLVARVHVNRLWEQMFGQGLVRTVEDFGMQGDWPSHPELIDWLAVEFRERGFDVRQLLRLMLTSATFRQQAVTNAAAQKLDGDDRWLAWFPRRRLSAEMLRDQALYTSGLLIERLGGPSVKPYQPEGLWQEVAMTQSNTRNYQRGSGDDLFRRSLYTYWKRACPPPNMLTLDAPTREFCTARRTTTNTPLQALVLWNDEQFVEAARGLAERTLAQTNDDGARIDAMFVRCTGKPPSPALRTRTLQTLQSFRQRYTAAPADAQALLKVGTRMPNAATPAAELAAWTLIANAVLNLDATVCTP